MSKTEDSARRFAQLEGERDYYKRIAEKREVELDALKRQIDENIEYLMNAQIVAEERDALAAHVDTLHTLVFEVDEHESGSSDQQIAFNTLFEAVAQHNGNHAASLARRDAIKQELAVKDFAHEVWVTLMKSYRTQKVLPLTMAKHWIERQQAEGHQ